MRELALFAGAGGGILGGKLLGWQTVCAVEINPYCQRVLMQRQDDGSLPVFPIWSDIRTFDGRPWAGLVDVISGGFPCQDISAAGNGAGIIGERSGLWTEMARVIREVEPSYVLVENSPMLTSRGLDRVLGDLAELRYDARWGVFSAAGVGAPHLRKRIWIVANARRGRRGGEDGREMEQQGRAEAIGASETLANAKSLGRIEGRSSDATEIPRGRNADRSSFGADNVGDSDRMRELQQEGIIGEVGRWPSDSGWWAVEPPLGRVAPRMANRVDQLSALGNGQVPRVAQRAWEALAP